MLQSNLESYPIPKYKFLQIPASQQFQVSQELGKKCISKCQTFPEINNSKFHLNLLKAHFHLQS